ncbi:DNA-binding protein [Pelagibacterium halotolerans]|uniref:DNA-binding protein n=1 Tax=Pelagibacterium halotolerans TaxID=531813 RepID=UPI00384B123F
MEDSHYELSDDLIYGAEAIAAFLGMSRRQVYHAAEQDHLPVFRIGSTICCRKSTLMTFITEREKRSASYRRGLDRE